MSNNNTALPADIRNAINSDATNYMHSAVPLIDQIYPCHIEFAYEAGATAWAPWKVKHDLLLEENERLRKTLKEITAIEFYSDKNNPSVNHIKLIAKKALAEKGGDDV